MPSDESQLPDGFEFECFDGLPAEYGDDIARHQGTLAGCILRGRRICTLRLRFGNFSAVPECPDPCMIRHGTMFVYDDASVSSPFTVELSNQWIRGNPARPDKSAGGNALTM